MFACLLDAMSLLSSSLPLLRGAVDRSAVCECDISWSYSLTFWESVIQYQSELSRPFPRHST